MNVLLTLRAETVCLIILLFLLFYSGKYSRGADKARFLRICIWALGHVAFDGITVITVNHLNAVPIWLNDLCHVIFYIFAVLFCSEFFCYIISLTFSAVSRKWVSLFARGIPILFALMTPFLRIDYLAGRGTNYSTGPCAYVGYGTAVVLILASAAVIILNFHKINRYVRNALIPMVSFMIMAIIIQVAVPELLFTGAGVTLVAVGMYFAVENPAGKYREWALMDLATSVGNKNRYTLELELLNKKYRTGAAPKPVSCMMCDLDELKRINDRYGHITGDEMIRLAAHVLTDELKHAYGIYRIGGDEFIAIYVDAAVKLAEKEVDAVRRACKCVCTQNGLPLKLSIGYSETSGNQSVLDIVKEADQKMYEEKLRVKKEKACIKV